MSRVLSLILFHNDDNVHLQVSAESGAYVKEQDEPTRVVSKSDEQKSRIKVAIKVRYCADDTDTYTHAFHPMHAPALFCVKP